MFVALKKKLAEQTVESFTEAVASVLLQNLGWVANQALNRTVNGALAHHISEPQEALKAAREKSTLCWPYAIFLWIKTNDSREGSESWDSVV